MKRLVDLVDRGIRDDSFTPATTDNTIFQRRWPNNHNAVPDIMEIGYQGNAAWGQRITVLLTRYGTGDLLQWLCLRLKVRSWLPAELQSKLNAGTWDYADSDSAWLWASSLGSVAIQKIEFQVGSTTIETIPGEYMDIWSRQWMDGGRAAVWDSDIYANIPPSQIRNTANPPWKLLHPTEDGYVYCWLPLSFLKRPGTSLPLIAIGEQEIRVHITLRPFADVIRMRATPRTSPTQTPLGQTIAFVDNSGPTPIPYDVTMPLTPPTFEDATILAGVVHIEDPLRSSYLRVPIEMLYEPVRYTTFDIPERLSSSNVPVSMQIRLDEFSGPIREICWFIQRKSVWRFNEWTNYGALLEDALIDSNISTGNGSTIPFQRPLMTHARVLVDNAVWRDEKEEWYRLKYGLAHRGGVRVSNGMIYGYVLGDAAGWVAQDLQPAGTVNTSKSTIRLDLTIQPPAQSEGWVVHVFGIGLNWLRFVNGRVGPLFSPI